MERPWMLPTLAAIVCVLAVALFWASKKPLKSETTSIVVLPFLNLTADPENEYFNHGLTEELIGALTRVDGLQVFKGKRGEPTKAEIVLAGSVRRAGNRLLITAQLVNSADGRHLWSQTYERGHSDIFAVQDEISQAIVNALRMQLRVDGSRPLVRRYTDNVEAYNLYLKGRYHLNRYSVEGLYRSIGYFQQAIGRDPHYAPAYAMLAASYGILGYHRELPAEQAWPKAQAAAAKAIEIDNTLAEGHAWLGFVMAIHDWDWASAEREYRRALELNPASPDAHGGYGLVCLVPTGQLDQAIAELQKALELDPVAFLNTFAAGHAFQMNHQYDRAVEHYRKAIELNPNVSDLWSDLGMVYAFQGKVDQARTAFEKMGEVRGNPKGRLGALELAMLGEREEALRIVNRLEELSRARYLRPIEMARIYALLCENDRSFEWLEKAFQEHDGQLIWLKVEPRFDNLRSDPRLAGFLKRLGVS